MRIEHYESEPYISYVLRAVDNKKVLTLQPEFRFDAQQPIFYGGPETRTGFGTKDYFFRPEITVPQMEITLLENVIVTGANMLFTDDGHALFGGAPLGPVYEPLLAPWSELSLQRMDGDNYACAKLKLIDEIESAYTIAYHAPGNYHHIMLDILPRLGLIDHPATRAFFAHHTGKTDLPILVNSDNVHIRGLLASVGRDTFDWLPIPKDRAVRVRKLFVPSATNNFHGWVTPEVHRFYRDIMIWAGVEATPSPYGPKIFSLRRDFPGDRRRIHNVEQVADILMGHGFVEYNPEQMTWRDEMVAFSQAQYIVGPMGSNLANMVFCPEGTRVLVLISNHSAFSLNVAMAAAGGQDIGFVWGEGFSMKSRGEHVEFYIDPVLLSEGLKSLLEPIEARPR